VVTEMGRQGVFAIDILTSFTNDVDEAVQRKAEEELRRVGAHIGIVLMALSKEKARRKREKKRL